jgi:tetratricopeptide (TPR) repeat protein
MKTFNSLGPLAVVMAALALFSSALAQSNDSFAKANEEYAHGQFPEAIKEYEALARAGQWSAPLFYNLGNAYFRSGDFAHAILNYERALALDPRHPEATANLGFARDESRALELQKDRFEPFLKFATSNQITIAATVAFWIAVFAIAAMILTRRRSFGLVILAILAMSVLTAALGCIVPMEKGAKSLAIVTRNDVEARVATADNATSVLALPSGSEVRIVSQRGDWIYALLPNNLRGWIPASSVESVRL